MSLYLTAVLFVINIYISHQADTPTYRPGIKWFTIEDIAYYESLKSSEDSDFWLNQKGTPLPSLNPSAFTFDVGSASNPRRWRISPFNNPYEPLVYDEFKSLDPVCLSILHKSSVCIGIIYKSSVSGKEKVLSSISGNYISTEHVLTISPHNHPIHPYITINKTTGYVEHHMIYPRMPAAHLYIFDHFRVCRQYHDCTDTSFNPSKCSKVNTAAYESSTYDWSVFKVNHKSNYHLSLNDVEIKLTGSHVFIPKLILSGMIYGNTKTYSWDGIQITLSDDSNSYGIGKYFMSKGRLLDINGVKQTYERIKNNAPTSRQHAFVSVSDYMLDIVDNVDYLKQYAHITPVVHGNYGYNIVSFNDPCLVVGVQSNESTVTAKILSGVKHPYAVINTLVQFDQTMMGGLQFDTLIPTDTIILNITVFGEDLCTTPFDYGGDFVLEKADQNVLLPLKLLGNNIYGLDINLTQFVSQFINCSIHYTKNTHSRIPGIEFEYDSFGGHTPKKRKIDKFHKIFRNHASANRDVIPYNIVGGLLLYDAFSEKMIISTNDGVGINGVFVIGRLDLSGLQDEFQKISDKMTITSMNVVSACWCCNLC